MIVIGNLWSNSAHINMVEYFSQLARQFSLHENEREMLISFDDSLVITQLLLAEIEKQVSHYISVSVATYDTRIIISSMPIFRVHVYRLHQSYIYVFSLLVILTWKPVK